MRVLALLPPGRDELLRAGVRLEDHASRSDVQDRAFAYRQPRARQAERRIGGHVTLEVEHGLQRTADGAIDIEQDDVGAWIESHRLQHDVRLPAHDVTPGGVTLLAEEQMMRMPDAKVAGELCRQGTVILGEETAHDIVPGCLLRNDVAVRSLQHRSVTCHSVAASGDIQQPRGHTRNVRD